MDRLAFARLVKDALTHLYDHVYLERLALNAALVPPAAQEAGATTLHRVLLEGIEGLRPPQRVPSSSPSWRPYLILSQRYVENLEPEQVAQELAISARQYRREQARGLQTVTELLWKRYQQLQQPAPREEQPDSLLHAEMGRLGVAGAGHTAPLAATVRGVAATLARLAEQQLVDLRVDLPDLPPVSVDRVVLRQLLLNILTHVLQHSQGVAVTLGAVAAEQSVSLAVNRPGGDVLPPGGDDNTGDDRLSVAARLAQMQGVHMAVKTDDGLVVRLELPIHQLPTVLVIDDNQDVIDLFRRYLGGGIYRVVGVTNGQEALRLVPEVRPQAITLDVMMPDQDGWEVLQSLRNLPETRGTPVIVCSVLRERDLALSLGATEFLAKPVTQEKLLATLARCTSVQGASTNPGLP